MTEYCFHCGSHVTDGWRFCRVCGTGVDAAPVANRSAFCTECGNGLAPSWRYCTRCGATTPVANASRSVHLSEEDMARVVEAANADRAGAETQVVETPSVELISRGWDVIDLRPTDEDVHAPPVATPPPRPDSPPEPRPVEPGVERPSLPAATLDDFRDPTPIGQYTQLALLGLGLLSVASIIGLVILNNRLEEFALTGEGGFARVETVQRVLDQWLRPLVTVVGIAAVGLLVAWTYRVYANLPALGKADLRLPATAAIWSWLIPGVNLAVPKVLIDDAWRGSDVYAATDPDWKRRPGNPWVLTFWIGIIGFIAFTAFGAFLGADTIEEAMDANAWAMLGYGALILAALAGTRMITAISERQVTRYRGLRARR